MDALRELTVWNRACQLAVDIVHLNTHCSDPAFREQLTRAAITVASSIAAGYERRSRPQFAEYLRTASSSCAQMRTQLYIGAEAGLFESGAAHRLIAETLQIGKLLRHLIRRCEHLT